MRISVPALIIASFSLAACQGGGLDGVQGGFQDNKNAVIGTGVGAAAGAILGRIVSSDDDPDEAQKVGILLGAAGGALLGSQLDKQEKALRQSLAGSGASIQNTGDALNVTLPEAITFPVDSAALRPGFVSDLRGLAANLNQFPNSVVNIVGHTDDTGSVSYNQQLSEQRARSVANVLINAGVSPNRISTAGEGEFSPVASNSTAAGRQQNRRVVVRITPTG